MSGHHHTGRIRFRLGRGVAELPWDSRTALVEEIRHLEAAKPIVEAIRAVGVSRPVELTPELKGLLIQLIDSWGTQTAGGLQSLPEGIFELRNALQDDPDEAEATSQDVSVAILLPRRILGDWVPSVQDRKKALFPGLSRRADDGTRTHDLLHGKQTL